MAVPHRHHALSPAALRLCGRQAVPRFALVAAMQAHTADAQVQIRGCMTICHIIPTGMGAVTLARLQAVADAGALPVIVAGMQAHEAEAEVQKIGCSVLYLVCFGSDEASRVRKQAAADAGALVAVVAAMRAHSSLDVRGPGGALHTICAGSDARRAAALQAGAQVEWLED